MVHFRHRTIAILLLAAWACAGTPNARGQDFAPQAKPEDFGLVVPNEPPQPGEGRRVLVQDSMNNLVVGRVHVEVGDRFLVVLPSGRIISVPKREATITERPFEPLSKDQLAEELTKEQFKGFKTRQTKRYLYIYSTSEPFYKATSTILETMYPALYEYCRRQKLPVEEPEAPLVVVMFRSQDDFDKYRPMPDGVVAYYNGVTNFVVMYEQSRLGAVAPDLAVKQAISTIAHEGVHQILHNIGVQQRLSRWPMWISEGLPEYFAPTQTDRGVRWKGVGLVNDLRQYSLQNMLKQGAGVEPGSLVEQTVQARSLTADGYAVAWALTHYLARNQQENFFAYLREVSQAKPLEEEPQDNLALFRKHFGQDLNELGTNMLKNLAKLPYTDPIVNQTHYVGMLIAGLRRSVIVSTSPASIGRWRDEQANLLSPADRSRARLQIQAFPNKAAAERYAFSWLNGR